ncbi:MAG: hypothetical protein ABIH63_04165 [archaeon]
MKEKLRNYFLECCSSIKQFFECFFELVPDTYKRYKWKTPFILLFLFFASIGYLIYKKFSD